MNTPTNSDKRDGSVKIVIVEGSRPRPDAELHWEQIIEAVRGSAAAQVWYDFKHGGEGAQL